jgi:ribose transport system substrate-binding protein
MASPEEANESETIRLPRIDEPRYLIKSLVHASQGLAAFRSEGEILRLRDLVERTGETRMTCFRIVYTLHRCGFLEKLAENQYRPRFIIRPKRKFVLGYVAHGQKDSFPRDVEESLIRAAEEANFELIVVTNRHDAKTAVRNAEHLVRDRVDLAIVFQTEEVAAPSIAARFLDAGIPLIAIDIPHPGATLSC